MGICDDLDMFQVVTFCDAELMIVQEATVTPLESTDGHFSRQWKFPGGRRDCSGLDAVLLSHSTAFLTIPLLMQGGAQVWATGICGLLCFPVSLIPCRPGVRHRGGDEYRAPSSARNPGTGWRAGRHSRMQQC